MEEELVNLEDTLFDIEQMVDQIQQENDDFEDMENKLDLNIDAAKLNKDFAFSLATLYLASKKLSGSLSKNDKVIKTIKKIKDNSDRIKKMEKFISQNIEKNNQSLDSQDLADYKLTKRNK